MYRKVASVLLGTDFAPQIYYVVIHIIPLRMGVSR